MGVKKCCYSQINPNGKVRGGLAANGQKPSMNGGTNCQPWAKIRRLYCAWKRLRKKKGRVSPAVVPVGKGMHFKSYLKNFDLSFHPAILLAHFSKSFHWFRCWELDTFMIFFFPLYRYSSHKSMVDQVFLRFLMFFAEWHASQEMLHKRWALVA